MRSPHYVTAAVRHPNGSIETRVEPFQSILKRHPVLNVPFLRGVIALVEMLSLGMSYLNWSSNIALEDQPAPTSPSGSHSPVASEPHVNGLAAGMPMTEVPMMPGGSAEAFAASADLSAATQPIMAAEIASATATHEAPPSGNGASDSGTEEKMPVWLFVLTVAASLSFGFLLFVALPNLVADWTLRRVTDDRIALNVFEGFVKLVIFVAYVWIIGRRPNIERVFEYHGAEHKVVYAAENHRPITPEGARPFDTPHPRCGTGFALLTVLVSVICFAFLPWTESHVTRVAMRFALMPVVAGISYEVIKLTTHPRWGGFAQWVMIPGLWLQRLTTRQPDDAQLEVSCAAMRILLDAEANHGQNQPVARPGLI